MGAVSCFKYDEETDENQNNSFSDASENERKSMTLDGRKMDSTLNKLRHAIRRKSTISMKAPASPPKVGKQRRESFIQKMFKRSPTKVEMDNHCAASQIDNESVISQGSELDDDPLYDKIRKTDDEDSLKTKLLYGSAVLLPEDTLDELKSKIRSRESLEKINIDPPQLPPRCFSTSLTTLQQTAPTNDLEEQDESDASGHYQRINQKPLEEIKTNENFSLPSEPAEPISLPNFEAEYQVIDKSKKKKNRLSIEDVQKELECFTSALKENEKRMSICDDSPKSEKGLEETLNDIHSILVRLRSGSLVHSPSERIIHPPTPCKLVDDYPDYDFPRPVIVLEVPADEPTNDKIEGIDHFLNSSPALSICMEPDSLESRRELVDEAC